MEILSKLKSFLFLPPSKDEEKKKVVLNPDMILPNGDYQVIEDPRDKNVFIIYNREAWDGGIAIKGKIKDAEAFCWAHSQGKI